MKLGLIVRMDNRGLGLQTWEMYRHLNPHVTVAVTMRAGRMIPEHPARYPGAFTVTYEDLRLHPFEEMLELLTTCDTVVTVETPYDHRLFPALNAAGVKSVLVGNFEFMEWVTNPNLPRPDLFIAPSTWRLDEWPENTVYLPHPVDRERLPFVPRERVSTFLHVAGQIAMRDRPGTLIMQEAVRFTRLPCVIRAQRKLPGTKTGRPGRNVYPHVRVLVEDVEDYPAVYHVGDALVAPRRYGGQSLPVNEALSLGMPVIALDREPERSMLPPESLVRCHVHDTIRTFGGDVEVFTAKPERVAKKMEELAHDTDLVKHLSKDADARASRMSWDVLGPKWWETLGA